MEKIIKVDGKSLHLILGKSIYEWCELFGGDIDLWNMPLEELLDGTLEVNESIWYYYIDGRCYETNKEV
jgi:hypothetical protein